MTQPTSDFDTPSMPRGGGGDAPEVTSLDVAINFVTEFNENTAIFAQVVGMLSAFQLPTIPMDPFGNPLVTGQLGAGVDPLTGAPLQGPSKAPVDVVELRGQVTELSGQVASFEGNLSSLQSQVSNASIKAILANHKASEARSIAVKALSRAGSCSCQSVNRSVAQSDAESPF